MQKSVRLKNYRQTKVRQKASKNSIEYALNWPSTAGHWACP